MGLRTPISTIEDAQAYIKAKSTQLATLTPRQKEKLKLAMHIVANAWAKPREE
jgi:hypothetical protein